MNRNMEKESSAPITVHQRNQLASDAVDIRIAAKRKGHTLDSWAEVRERDMARQHFELGCWLFYYASRIGKPDGFKARVDCARRLFEAGIYSPKYDFYTVFDFGERQFDAIFEMGDADEVIEELRSHLSSLRIQEAFRSYGWPTCAAQAALPL